MPPISFRLYSTRPKHPRLIELSKLPGHPVNLITSNLLSRETYKLEHPFALLAKRGLNRGCRGKLHETLAVDLREQPRQFGHGPRYDLGIVDQLHWPDVRL